MRVERIETRAAAEQLLVQRWLDADARATVAGIRHRIERGPEHEHSISGTPKLPLKPHQMRQAHEEACVQIEAQNMYGPVQIERRDIELAPESDESNDADGIRSVQPEQGELVDFTSG